MQGCDSKDEIQKRGDLQKISHQKFSLQNMTNYITHGKGSNYF